ncbi:MAG: hypothetical protein WC815_20125 [Vicinamibacterales bacterium]|jgi:hypothetical protein
MTAHRRAAIVVIASVALATFAAVEAAVAQDPVPSTLAPAAFVSGLEASSPQSSGADAPLQPLIDRRSTIRIAVDNDKARAECQRIQAARCLVTLRVQARLQKKGAATMTPLPLDNYTSVEEATVKDKPTYSMVTHDKTIEITRGDSGYGLDQTAPGTFISLAALGVQPGDRLYLKITNIRNQLDMDYITEVGEFGWNSRVADSFLLLRRLKVSEQDEKDGVKDVNFRPAPGVSFGWVYTSRTNAFWRAVAPGLGYGVSFTDWSDPAFDPATGKFAKGTESSKIEIAAGPIVTLFDNTLQLSFGWNLNVRQDRRYVAIGFSFFKLSEKLTSLIKQ